MDAVFKRLSTVYITQVRDVFGQIVLLSGIQFDFLGACPGQLVQGNKEAGSFHRWLCFNCGDIMSPHDQWGWCARCVGRAGYARTRSAGAGL